MIWLKRFWFGQQTNNGTIALNGSDSMATEKLMAKFLRTNDSLVALMGRNIHAELWRKCLARANQQVVLTHDEMLMPHGFESSYNGRSGADCRWKSGQKLAVIGGKAIYDSHATSGLISVRHPFRLPILWDALRHRWIKRYGLPKRLPWTRWCRYRIMIGGSEHTRQ